MAQCVDGREAEDVHSIASTWIPVVLLLEIACCRTVSASRGFAAADRHDGGRESDGEERIPAELLVRLGIRM